VTGQLERGEQKLAQEIIHFGAGAQIQGKPGEPLRKSEEIEGAQ
jgi:hypothetical protein